MNKNNKISPILIIDDDRSILEFFRDVYGEMGLTVDTEYDGTIGMRRITERQYKLIFLDVMLININGIEILKYVKSINNNVAVIMISGYLTESVIEEALFFGADGYLYKPLTARDIMSKTMEYLHKTDFK